jgi:hypothetical protein
LITEKENYLRLLRGEIPEFIPRYRMMDWIIFGNPFRGKKSPEGYDIDEFGMVHTTNESSMGGAMPVPGHILLDDITRWRDVIKTPDVDSVDWEKYTKERLAERDTANNPVIVGVGDFFIKLVNFMSFTEGLIALVEEPEECYAMMEYLCEYYIKLLKKQIYYYKPEVLSLADDIAADQMPFIDLETYRKYIKPHHKRLADIALDNGMLISMHCCGKCEIFLDDFVDMGVSAWEPAQAGNDFVAIKKKFGSKLAIMGGWDSTGPFSLPGTTDDELRQALIEYVDTLAPGGGFAYMARVATTTSKEDAEHKNAICDEIYETYARDWYKTH